MIFQMRNVLVLILTLLFLPTAPTATQFSAGRGNIISSSDTIPDDIYFFGNFVEVYGRVDGDLFAFCFDAEVDGEITGSANIIAYRTDLAGKVSTSARLIGKKVRAVGEIGRNLVAIGSEVEIGKEMVIQRDLTCLGNVVKIEGHTRGNVHVKAGSVSFAGIVDGNLEITADEIRIARGAQINGEFKYTSPQKADIDAGTTIVGETTWKMSEGNENKGKSSFLSSSIFKVVLFLMALLTGLVLILLFKNHTRESSVQMEKRFVHTLVSGLLTLLIILGGILILSVIIIGIPLAIFLLGMGILLFYIGKIYVSIFLGRLIFGLLNRNKRLAIGWELFLGLVILSLVFQIPILGFIIYILVFILGAGAAVAGYINLNRDLKKAGGVAQASAIGSSS